MLDGDRHDERVAEVVARALAEVADREQAHDDVRPPHPFREHLDGGLTSERARVGHLDVELAVDGQRFSQHAREVVGTLGFGPVDADADRPTRSRIDRRLARELCGRRSGQPRKALVAVVFAVKPAAPRGRRGVLVAVDTASELDAMIDRELAQRRAKRAEALDRVGAVGEHRFRDLCDAQLSLAGRRRLGEARKPLEACAIRAAGRLLGDPAQRAPGGGERDPSRHRRL